MKQKLLALILALVLIPAVLVTAAQAGHADSLMEGSYAVIGGDEVLTKVCRPVENFDKKLHNLLDDMAQTMYKANGVGLAGPQVGMLRRLFVVDVGEGLNYENSGTKKPRSGKMCLTALY